MIAGTGRGRLAAVLWDLDGTLVDSEKVWDVSLAELAAHLGGRLSGPARRAMVGSHLMRSVGLMFDDLHLSRDVEAERRAADRLLRRTTELFARGLPWRPGAQDALRAVRDAGLPTALVTSTHRALTEVALATVGRDSFDVTVCGDEVLAPKPHPAPFLRAAELLGVSAADCVAVEDSPTGTAAAVAAGCTVVVVVPGEVPVPPGERRVLRPSLVGLDAAGLAALVEAPAA